MNRIHKGIRVINYLIDYFIIFAIWIFTFIILQDPFIAIPLFYVVMFLYYFLFEMKTGQTLGKMVTKTKVIANNGVKPSVFKILFRSFLRLIPIDIVSYLFGTELGFHDVLSSTKLIKITLTKK